MKKFRSLAVAILLYSLFVACSADQAQQQQNTDLASIVTQGTWKVTHYTDHGGNETMHFVAYTFTFHSNNTVVASTGTTQVTGNWNITDNNSSSLYTDLSTSTDDTPNDLVDFNISFPVANLDFNDIEDDWDVVTKSATEIVLKDGNQDDPTKIDYITFEKVPTPSVDLASAIRQGTWQVAYYSDHGSNQSLNFIGYSFVFSANGSIVVTNGTAPVNGSWTITTNNNSPLYTAPATSDDSLTDPNDFNLFFPAVTSPLIFTDIEDDWDIVYVSSNTIMLKDEVTLTPTLNDYIIFRKLP
ncbi:MAG: hypothetical protein ACOYOR_08425 [Flavobacterium psychrophilum]